MFHTKLLLAQNLGVLCLCSIKHMGIKEIMVELNI